MRKMILLVCFVASQVCARAQDMRLPLWAAGKVPNFRESGEKERSDSADFVSIRLVQQPDIAVYLPTKRSATGQAIVICPGGGYGMLAYNWEGSDVARMLNAKGIAAVVLKYRLPNSKSNITPHLSPLMDAQRAIRMTRHFAAKWNIDKNKVGIMGFSAGGHLASTAGTHFDAGKADATDSIDSYSSRPDFMILIYPVISMSKPIMHSGSRNNLIGKTPTEELAKNFSNELQVTKNTPPTFLVHSTDDKAVPVENTLLFYQALKDNNVPTEMHIYPYGGHGFALATGQGYLETWADRCIDWLKSLNKAK